MQTQLFYYSQNDNFFDRIQNYIKQKSSKRLFDTFYYFYFISNNLNILNIIFTQKHLILADIH